MNTGLKNKLLIMAAAAGLAGFGVACGSSTEEAPAAEEAPVEATTGGETEAPATDAPAEAPAEGAPAEGAAAGEGSCGEGKCG